MKRMCCYYFLSVQCSFFFRFTWVYSWNLMSSESFFLEFKEVGWVLVFKIISFYSRMQHDITISLNFTKLLVQGPLKKQGTYKSSWRIMNKSNSATCSFRHQPRKLEILFSFWSLSSLMDLLRKVTSNLIGLVKSLQIFFSCFLSWSLVKFLYLIKAYIYWYNFGDQ